MHDLLVALDIDSLCFVGHDFGGPVAITLLRMFQQLHLRGLALCSSNVFTDTFVPLPLRTASIPFLGAAVFKLIAGRWVGMGLVHAQAAADKQALPWARLRRHPSPRGMDCTRRIFQRSLADLVGNDQAVRDHLANIAAASIVIWGERDPLFCALGGRANAQSAPRRGLSLLPRCRALRPGRGTRPVRWRRRGGVLYSAACRLMPPQVPGCATRAFGGQVVARHHAADQARAARPSAAVRQAVSPARGPLKSSSKCSPAPRVPAARRCASCARNWTRRILPEMVLGSSVTNSMRRTRL